MLQSNVICFVLFLKDIIWGGGGETIVEHYFKMLQPYLKQIQQDAWYFVCITGILTSPLLRNCMSFLPICLNVGNDNIYIFLSDDQLIEYKFDMFK